MRRAIVLGLARSGEAAAALLERHGVEVVRAGRELGNDGDVSLLDGADVLVKSPGVPRDNPLVRGKRRERVADQVAVEDEDRHPRKKRK